MVRYILPSMAESVFLDNESLDFPRSPDTKSIEKSKSAFSLPSTKFDRKVFSTKLVFINSLLTKYQF